MTKLHIRIETIVLILYFIIIGTNISSSICYIVFGLIVFFFSIKRKFFIRILPWDFISVSFILLWLYGLILGFFYKNKTEYIIANNAGMILYFLYYILLQFRISKEKIYNLLLISALVIGLITIFLFIFNIIGLPLELISAILGEFTGGSSTGQLRVYFVSQISLFPALAIYMSAFIASKYQKKYYFNIVDFKQNLKVFAAFIIYTMCTMFFTASKGFMLGYLFILFFLPFSLFFKNLYLGRINKRIIVFIVLIAFLVLILISFGYFNIVTAIFDNNDGSNILRYEQLYFLLQDLTIWGKGLGAVVPGYSRNLEKPYGFELSYLSLIHKFGLLGLIAVILYLVTFWKALKNIIQGHNVKYAIASVGAISYLLPSIGNPLIFAPQAVALHCVALYLLRKDKN